MKRNTLMDISALRYNAPKCEVATLDVEGVLCGSTMIDDVNEETLPGGFWGQSL